MNDNHTPLTEHNNNISILDNYSDVTANNWNIRFWNNFWRIEGKNWNIFWDNNSEWSSIISKNGEVNVRSNWVMSSIEAKNGGVTVSWDNDGVITVKNGDVIVRWSNNFSIESKNWSIYVNENNKSIVTENGSISIWNYFELKSIGWTNISISWGNGITITWNNTVFSSIWSIWNISFGWECYINWVKVSWDNVNISQKRKVMLNGIVIDFDKETFSLNWVEEEFTSIIYREQDVVFIVDRNKEVDDCVDAKVGDQFVEIRADGIFIKNWTK